MEGDDHRDKANEQKHINALATFDFNEGLVGGYTLEESLMQELTNDIGEQVSAQSTEVLI